MNRILQFAGATHGMLALMAAIVPNTAARAARVPKIRHALAREDLTAISLAARQNRPSTRPAA